MFWKVRWAKDSNLLLLWSESSKRVPADFKKRQPKEGIHSKLDNEDETCCTFEKMCNLCTQFPRKVLSPGKATMRTLHVRNAIPLHRCSAGEARRQVRGTDEEAKMGRAKVQFDSDGHVEERKIAELFRPDAQAPYISWKQLFGASGPCELEKVKTLLGTSHESRPQFKPPMPTFSSTYEFHSSVVELLAGHGIVMTDTRMWLRHCSTPVAPIAKRSKWDQ